MENSTNNTTHSYSERERDRESTNSSPRSFEDHPLPTKLRFMCSYGGKIHPNPNLNNHAHYLTYSGGDTKILSVDRSITFSQLIAKLSSLCNYPHLHFKYQLPGEDLDSLISVTNDEDLELMLFEYDRLFRAHTAKTPRLRLFVFPLNETLRNKDWFAEGLGFGGSNPDYLFGLDKGFLPGSLAGGGSKDVSDCGSEDRSLAGDFPPDFHRHNALLANKKLENSSADPNTDPNNRVYTGSYNYYGQKSPEGVIAAPPAKVAVPVTVQLPVEIVQERHVASGARVPSLVGSDTPLQPVYYIPTPAGLRPAAGQVGHPYYTSPGAAAGQMLFAATGMAAPPVQGAQPKVVMAEPDGVAVGFDASGRRVYYTAAGGVAPVYKVMGVGGGALSAENRVVAANVNHQNISG